MYLSSQTERTAAKLAASTTNLKPYEIQFRRNRHAEVTAWVRFYLNDIYAREDALKVLAETFNGKAALVNVIEVK